MKNAEKNIIRSLWPRNWVMLPASFVQVMRKHGRTYIVYASISVQNHSIASQFAQLYATWNRCDLKLNLNFEVCHPTIYIQQIPVYTGNIQCYTSIPHSTTCEQKLQHNSFVFRLVIFVHKLQFYSSVSHLNYCVQKLKITHNFSHPE